MDRTACHARPHPVMWVAALSVTLLSLTGVGAILGWLPGPADVRSAVQAPVTIVEPKDNLDRLELSPAPFEPDAVPAIRAGVHTVLARHALKSAGGFRPVAAQAGSAATSSQAQTRVRRTLLAQAPAAAPARRVCTDCGIVESVHEVKQAGQGTGLGAVAGGVLGGLLGHQIGKGRGNTVATVAGAVGGAVAGHQVERSVRSTAHHEITVRMEEGGTRTVSVDGAPAWRPGDKVRVIDGKLLADN